MIWTLVAYLLGILTVVLYRQFNGVIEGWRNGLVARLRALVGK